MLLSVVEVLMLHTPPASVISITYMMMTVLMIMMMMMIKMMIKMMMMTTMMMIFITGVDTVAAFLRIMFTSSACANKKVIHNEYSGDIQLHCSNDTKIV